MEVGVKMSPDKICRTCLRESVDLKALTSKPQDKSITLLESLNFIINFNVLVKNGQPYQLCSDCEFILLKADAFKRRCLEAEVFLSQHFDVSSEDQTQFVFSEKSVIKDETLQEVVVNSITDPTQTTSSVVKLSDSSLNNAIETFSQKADQVAIFASSTGSKHKRKRKKNNEAPVYEHDVIKTVKVEQNLEFDDQNYLSFDYDQSVDYEADNFDCKQEETSSDTKIFTCSCGTVCQDKDDYRLHLFTTNCSGFQKKRKSRKTNEKKVATVPIDTNVKKIECSECNQMFASVKSCKLHFKRYHHDHDEEGNFECTMCERKFNRKSAFSNHVKNHDLKATIKFTCDTCKREFQHKAHLDNHILNVHTRDKGFPCEECLKSFSTQASLDVHKESHKILKKHQCKICKKAFQLLSTLNDHMRVHTGEKPYLCSICGKGFSQKTNLAQHVRRHQGLKPFKCQECERRFVSKGELQAHARSHSGAHPFVCEDCGSGFTTSSSLVKHRRIHTGERPYACDMCPMRFAASGTLNNHRRTHTGEKPFQCSYCEKAFVQRHDLVAHIRCHTGERPYTCACGQSFRKASALKAHKRLHGKDQRDIALLQSGLLLNNIQTDTANPVCDIQDVAKHPTDS